MSRRGLEEEAAEMIYLNYQQAPYWQDMILMVRIFMIVGDRWH